MLARSGRVNVDDMPANLSERVEVLLDGKQDVGLGKTRHRPENDAGIAPHGNIDIGQRLDWNDLDARMGFVQRSLAVCLLNDRDRCLPAGIHHPERASSFGQQDQGLERRRWAQMSRRRDDSSTSAPHPIPRLAAPKLDATISTRSISELPGLEAVHHPAPNSADPWSGPWPDAINP